MAYFQIIESNQTWSCPKTATYKIICVAGGQGGGEATRGNGGTTSFGNILSSAGQWEATNSAANYLAIGGSGGYTLNEYGGAGGVLNLATLPSATLTPSKNGGLAEQPGLGWGGGGFAAATATGKPGGNGILRMRITNITAGTNVPCTIGAGGSAGVNGGAGVNGVIVVQEV